MTTAEQHAYLLRMAKHAEWLANVQLTCAMKDESEGRDAAEHIELACALEQQALRYQTTAVQLIEV